MNRFRTKKKGKKVVHVEPQPPTKEIDLSNALPSTDDFRTSLIMPKLSARFSMLKEQDDPHTKIGKANDDSVLFPKRQSRMNMFSNGLSDIAEVASIKSSMNPTFSEERTASLASLEGYGSGPDEEPHDSIMSRPRPGEGNVLFGGRQKIYKIPMHSASDVSSRSGMSSRTTYDQDSGLSAFQRYRLEAKEKERREMEEEVGPKGESTEENSPVSPNETFPEDQESSFIHNKDRDTSSSTMSGPSNQRTSTAATSVTSQNALRSSMKGTDDSTSSVPESARSSASPTLERSYTKARRLYGKGLDRDLHDQQYSAVQRLDNLQKLSFLRNPTPALSKSTSATDLSDRYRQPKPLYASSSFKLNNPERNSDLSESRVSDDADKSPTSSHHAQERLTPMSSPLSEVEESPEKEEEKDYASSVKVRTSGSDLSKTSAFDDSASVKSHVVVKKESQSWFQRLRNLPTTPRMLHTPMHFGPSSPKEGGGDSATSTAPDSPVEKPAPLQLRKQDSKSFLQFDLPRTGNGDEGSFSEQFSMATEQKRSPPPAYQELPLRQQQANQDRLSGSQKNTDLPFRNLDTQRSESTRKPNLSIRSKSPLRSPGHRPPKIDTSGKDHRGLSLDVPEESTLTNRRLGAGKAYVASVKENRKSDESSRSYREKDAAKPSLPDSPVLPLRPAASKRESVSDDDDSSVYDDSDIPKVIEPVRSNEQTNASDRNYDMDSPTLGPEPNLSGLVRNHLRQDSDASSYYPDSPESQTPGLSSNKNIDGSSYCGNPWKSNQQEESAQELSKEDILRSKTQDILERARRLREEVQADEAANARPNPPFNLESPMPSPAVFSATFQSEIRPSHARALSTDTQMEREEFEEELAERRRQVQAKLKSHAESQSRSSSPAPSLRSFLRSKTQTVTEKSKGKKLFGKVPRPEILRDEEERRGRDPRRARDNMTPPKSPRFFSRRDRSASRDTERDQPSLFRSYIPLPITHDDQKPVAPVAGSQPASSRPSEDSKYTSAPPSRADTPTRHFAGRPRGESQDEYRSVGPSIRSAAPSSTSGSQRYRSDSETSRRSASRTRTYREDRGRVMSPPEETPRSPLSTATGRPGRASSETVNSNMPDSRSSSAMSGRYRSNSRTTLQAFYDPGAVPPRVPQSVPFSVNSTPPILENSPFPPNMPASQRPPQSFDMMNLPHHQSQSQHRKKSIKKFQISDPHFVSTTSTQQLVHRSSLGNRNADNDSHGGSPPIPPMNPRRRLLSNKSMYGGYPQGGREFEPPPVPRSNTRTGEDDFHRSESLSKAQLRKISSEGGNLNIRAKQNMNAPPYHPSSSHSDGRTH